MPKLTDTALDERRNHILRAAELCFAKNGFRSTTIADVKRQAGVSTGAIYTYFPNKEAMIRALLEAARDDRKRQLERATKKGGAGNGGQALLLLQWAAAVFAPQGQHAARIDVNLWSEALRSARIGKLARASLQEATEAVTKVVAAQLQAQGTPNAFDPKAAASMLIALYLGLEVQVAVGMKLDPTAMAQALTTAFAGFLPTADAPTRTTKPKRGRRGGS